ncbi:MAG: DUF455 family protein [Sandaracinaceae bacterium]
MEAPPAGTRERWAWALIRADALPAKLDPPPRPTAREAAPPERRRGRPGRPPELRVVDRLPKTPRPGALVDPGRRAELLHRFLHHEVQAAELMAWALLAFPGAPEPFKRGLMRIADDELRHARLYRAHLRTLGADVGDFPVRDWFWCRVPTVPSPLAFVTLVGLGLEGANLDHTARWAAAFRAAGDEQGARLLERVGREEEPHVRFALRWYERWRGPLTFEGFRDGLPPPLTPLLFRGRPADRAARRRAGMGAPFIDALVAYAP